MLAVLVVVETTDIVFAIDSVPAILAITTNTFIVFAANAFAILGLRSLYFVLAGMMRRFVYLQLGLSVLLVFVGAKMFANNIVGKTPIEISLPVILGVLAITIAASLIKTRGLPASRCRERRISPSPPRPRERPTTVGPAGSPLPVTASGPRGRQQQDAVMRDPASVTDVSTFEEIGMTTQTEAPVLIAYDGSSEAKNAVREAGSLLRGRRAIVVTVWRSAAEAAGAARIALPDDVIQGAVESLDAAAAEAARELAAEGAQLAAAAGLVAEPLEVACQTNAWATIVRVAEEHDAAAVVLGSRGRSAVKSAVLGSVSSGVAHHCRRPVMITRAASD